MNRIERLAELDVTSKLRLADAILSDVIQDCTYWENGEGRITLTGAMACDIAESIRTLMVLVTTPGWSEMAVRASVWTRGERE